MTHALMVLALLLLTLLGCVACGDGAQIPTPIDCDPIQDVGCPEGEHCRVVRGGALTCLRPSGPRTPCVPGSCSPGAACAEVEGLLGCTQVCTLGAPDGCGEGVTCRHAIATDSAWGLCLTPCDFDEGCEAEDATCAPLPGQPTMVCVGIGDAQLGASCVERRCAAGLACLNIAQVVECAQLCRPGDNICGAQRCAGVVSHLPDIQFCTP